MLDVTALAREIEHAPFNRVVELMAMLKALAAQAEKRVFLLHASPAEPDVLLSWGEVGRQLGISRDYARRMWKGPVVRVGKQGTRVPQSAVTAFLRGGGLDGVVGTVGRGTGHHSEP